MNYRSKLWVVAKRPAGVQHFIVPHRKQEARVFFCLMARQNSGQSKKQVLEAMAEVGASLARLQRELLSRIQPHYHI